MIGRLHTTCKKSYSASLVTPHYLWLSICLAGVISCNHGTLYQPDHSLSCEPDIRRYDNCETPCVRYVRADAWPGGSGDSWEQAFSTVQEAIDDAHCAARRCAASCQVWVAGGIYYVYRGDKHDTVQLRPGVEFFGGFAGDEVALDQRDSKANPTVLDGCDGGPCNNRVYHVVTGSDDALIDGFTITNGNADDVVEEHENSVECAGEYGQHCAGGGMLNVSAAPTVRNCTFAGNEARLDGGAIASYDSKPTINACVFSKNHAGVNGGAIIGSVSSDLTITNSVFTENSGTKLGGALFVDGGSVSIVNSTFWNNEAWGGFSWCGGATIDWSSDWTGKTNKISLVNSIIYNSKTCGIPHEYGSYDGYGRVLVIDHSLVYDGYIYYGTLYNEPVFVDAEAGDLHLHPYSSAIDSALDSMAPATDIEGNPRVDQPDRPGDDCEQDESCGMVADIGAYEFVGQVKALPHYVCDRKKVDCNMPNRRFVDGAVTNTGDGLSFDTAF
ncbi:MAG: hypothetical protein GXP49_18940, partial [Deltaproteobacteria bacterium]|nr:hypothetical protein [Deltaproteobacteria bacterium]